MAKKTGLGGQGVDLLFGDNDTTTEEKYFDCSINKIIPNKYQPRTEFNEEDLEELSNSIKENGIIQPLIVTAGEEENKYSLVAGERRLRASLMAGLKKVPVILMDVKNDDSLLELALIENIQRTDLNAIEEAEAYKNLIEKFNYTQEQTAKKVGKKRTTVTNALRLLKLPENIQQDVKTGLLSEGHARTLIKIQDNSELLAEVREKIIQESLSVRQTEQLVKDLTSPEKNREKKKEKKKEAISSNYIKTLTTALTNRFNSKIVINQNGSKGKVEIEYHSEDDLKRVYSLLISK